MGCSKFWIGMATGVVVGAIAYRCARTEKAKQWKEAMCHKMRNAGGFFEQMKGKAVDAGVKVADKIAEKAEDARERAHDFARDITK